MLTKKRIDELVKWKPTFVMCKWNPYKYARARDVRECNFYYYCVSIRMM